jgi:metal-responsive CopG/Arc/MetJ family transcriptional regulator
MLPKRGRTKKKNTTLAPRISVTFPPDLYRNLEQMAKQKKVSVAWVVRDAAEKYVADQWPLFKGQE